MSYLKKSCGIALCKVNKKNKFCILMVKKRFTYHFFEFVNGKYKRNKNKLMHLFNNMTHSEKICILSMKFSNMWYKIWLVDPEKIYSTHDKKFYLKKKNIFQSLIRNNYKKIVHLINNSKNIETQWDIPKGLPNSNESDLMTGIREFEEETGVNGISYDILWHADPVSITYTDDGVSYRYIYYLAKPNCDFKIKNVFKELHKMIEIDTIKWVSIDEIDFLNMAPIYKNRIIDLFKRVKKSYKNEIKLCNIQI